MAKTKGPLFGLGASGQLGKTIVFSSWKGIGVAREYVKPSNPKTGLQDAQRANMTAAVTAFHDAHFTVVDMTAWARLAGIQSKVMSGFNVFTKIFVQEAILENIWTPLSAVVIDEETEEGFDIQVTKTSTGDKPMAWCGTRPTFLESTEEFIDATGNVWNATVEGQPADSDIYMQVRVGASAADYGCTGIYKVHTLPATP